MMTISNDPWHFPRTELAKQILGMFETGLASSLTFLPHAGWEKLNFTKRYYAPSRTAWMARFLFQFFRCRPA
jgi:hypothetical protein